MKVTHLSKSDIQGGAARAAYRIHVGLGQIGVDSKMLVDDKIGYDPAVHAPEGIISKAWTMVRPSVNNIPLKFYDWQKTPFYTAWIGRNPAAHYLLKQSDIIHLHWIAGGLVSIKDISRLAKLGKPIVWTLPDMWAFTGGCHYAGNCEKYIDSCGKCPQLGSNRSNDITRKIWKRKRRAYANLNLTIVAPSRWLAECARRSSLLCDSKIETIPFGLNTDIFKPINKLLAREILNLPKERRIILFGALNETYSRKGFGYLREAIGEWGETQSFRGDELCIITLGSSNSKDIEEFSSATKSLGRLYDDFSLAFSYSAADVFVCPSLQEAFGQMYTEAMSCGTPCVAFDHSGPKDIIDHKLNGYLAEYKSSQSLAEGIRWVLEDEKGASKLGEAARTKAVQEYSLQIQAERYESLYSYLLESKREVEYRGSRKCAGGLRP